MSEHVRLKSFVAELVALRDCALVMKLSALDAWCVLATIQLACRHPEFTGSTRQIAEGVARRMQASLTLSPALQDLAERGWNPEYDEEVSSNE
jgi:hypothetical protein